MYRAGQDNKHTDALSRSPLPLASGTTNMSLPHDANVAAAHSHEKELIEHLLQAPPVTVVLVI